MPLICLASLQHAYNFHLHVHAVFYAWKTNTQTSRSPSNDTFSHTQGTIGNSLLLLTPNRIRYSVNKWKGQMLCCKNDMNLNLTFAPASSVILGKLVNLP